jgi:hypothetical protein
VLVASRNAETGGSTDSKAFASQFFVFLFILILFYFIFLDIILILILDSRRSIDCMRSCCSGSDSVLRAQEVEGSKGQSILCCS